MMMLENIMHYIHNYFVKERYYGKFRINNGEIVCNFLQDFQYYKISGSVFNDGVHRYLDRELIDEEFDGEVCALAVPPALVELSLKVQEWEDNYGRIIESPYTSESYGEYSYTKSSGGGDLNGRSKPMMDWRDVFGSQLNQWRKIS